MCIGRGRFALSTEGPGVEPGKRCTKGLVRNVRRSRVSVCGSGGRFGAHLAVFLGGGLDLFSFWIWRFWSCLFEFRGRFGAVWVWFLEVSEI